MSKQSFFNVRHVVTRKEHRCVGCEVKIPAGTKVEKHAGVFEGSFFSSYMCDECAEFLSKHRADFEDGYASGDIGEARRAHAAYEAERVGRV